MRISIVIPFYKGNQYLDKLLKSIEFVKNTIDQSIEVIIVNDSPNIGIILPKSKLDIIVIQNEVNLGIQGTRVRGLENSNGDWIIFLDQDDELRAEGFRKQISFIKDYDVIVGNGRYILGNVNKQIFKNKKSMNYLIQEQKFIEIRNLIPSPGECLIRKSSIPKLWIDNKLINNGADDWFLWILLFKGGARFACNEELVYIHNDSQGENLSANLNKMRLSSLEMAEILKKNKILNKEEFIRLCTSIEFKFNQDTNQLSLKKILKYRDAFASNIKYRTVLNFLCR